MSWLLAVVWLSAGCNLVFPIDPGSDAQPSDTGLDASACAAPVDGWGQPMSDTLTQAFSSTQEMSNPTIIDDPGPGGEVMLFDIADDVQVEPRAIRWASFATGNFVSQGNVLMDVAFISYDHPRLFATDDTLRLLFFGRATGAATHFEAVPGAMFGRDWVATAVEVPSDLQAQATFRLGTPGLRGARVVAEVGGMLTELARTAAGTYARLATDTLVAVNQAGGGTSPQLADDGCWVVFSRFEDGDIGNPQDLFIAIRQPDGTFGAPQQLPSMAGVDERDPFVTPDTTRLYFVSPDGTGKLRPRFLTRTP